MDEKTTKLLEDIKVLLMLQLVDNDVPGKKIADALGVDPATVSRTLNPKPKNTKKK